MTSRGRAGFALLLFLSRSLWADATVRYHTDIQTSALIPAAALDQALGSVRDMEVRIKGNKGYSSLGPITTIVDLKTQDLSLIDWAHKRFATVPASQYADQVKGALPEIPEQARSALAAMKTSIESHNTGRVAAIQGIQTEEREFVLTVDMPLPATGPQMSGPFIKMTMQIWTAKPGEMERVPALQEFNRYRISAASSADPAEMMKQIVGALPGLGDSLGDMFKDLSKNGGMALRTHMQIAAPILALVSQQLPKEAGQVLPPGFDPNAPLMQMNQEVVEISDSPLDDAMFQIPADYRQVSVEEILKSAVAEPPPVFK